MGFSDGPEDWLHEYLCSLTERELDRLIVSLEREAERLKMAKTTPAPAKVAAKAPPAKAPPAKTAATAKAPVKTAAAAPPPPSLDPVAAKLAEMKERWAKGRESAKTATDFGEGTTLNDGKHACKLTGAKIWTGGDAIKVIFEFTKVEGDDQIGEKAEKWDGTDTDEAMMYLLRDLTRLGIEDLDSLEPEQLPDICTALLEAQPAVRISIKTNANGYKNAYIDKLIVLEGDGTIPDASTSDPTPEEPAAKETGEPEPESDGTEPEPEAGAEDGVAEPEGGEEAAPEPEPEPEPEVETIEKGDEVSYRYRDPVSKQVVDSSGMVRRVFGEGDDEKVEVKDDNTNKVLTFKRVHVQKLALPATE